MFVGLFSWTVFPLTLAASIVGAVWLLSRGVSPEQAILPSTLLSFLLVAVCERFLPLHQSWLH
jgi:hypothetical protein